MNTFKKMFLTIPIMLIVLLVNRYGELYAQPVSGDWQVPTAFGEFVFTVNTAGTYITKLVITYSDWTCGSVTQNGTISTQSSPGWPISENQFTIQKNIDPSGNITITINGTFNQTGNETSGTWSSNVYGTICSGNWGPVGPVSSIKEAGSGISEQFVLAQSYPNPFNSTTTIEFTLPYSALVTLKIYNILGKEVSTLVSEELTAGKHEYNWDASDMVSGVYLYRMTAGDFGQTRKLILLR